MLLSELNLRSIGVNASSVLPVVKNLAIEGVEVEFKITAFQSGYGSGKKSVVSGAVLRKDTGVLFVLENSDIEVIRRKVAKLIGLKTTSERKPRTPKVDTEVKKISDTLKVVRRIYASYCWVDINVEKLRNEFKAAREIDRENKREMLKAHAVAPILERVAKLSPEERALLLASLQ